MNSSLDLGIDHNLSEVTAAPTEQPSAPRTTASFLPIGLAVWSFLCTILVAPYYTGGDQRFYRTFYDTQEGASIVDSYSDYNNLLSSNEPGYFLIVWLFSSWMNKDVLMSLLNAVFGFYLGRGLVALKTSPVVSIAMGLNYYLLVLYLAADRLKVGVLFLLISAAHRGIPRYLSFIFAVLSHVQSAVLIVGRLFSNFVSTVSPMLRGRIRRDLLWVPLGLLSVALSVLYLREHTEQKLEAYMTAAAHDSVSLLKPLVFLACTVAYAPNRRWEAAAMHMPVLIGSALVGPERLAIFSYFIFIYYGVQVRGGLNVGVLVSCAYFMITGLVFISDVINYGSGFYWATPAILRLLG